MLLSVAVSWWCRWCIPLRCAVRVYLPESDALKWKHLLLFPCSWRWKTFRTPSSTCTSKRNTNGCVAQLLVDLSMENMLHVKSLTLLLVFPFVTSPSSHRWFSTSRRASLGRWWKICPTTSTVSWALGWPRVGRKRWESRGDQYESSTTWPGPFLRTRDSSLPLHWTLQRK